MDVVHAPDGIGGTRTRAAARSTRASSRCAPSRHHREQGAGEPHQGPRVAAAAAGLRDLPQAQPARPGTGAAATGANHAGRRRQRTASGRAPGTPGRRSGAATRPRTDPLRGATGAPAKPPDGAIRRDGTRTGADGKEAIPSGRREPSTKTAGDVRHKRRVGLPHPYNRQPDPQVGRRSVHRVGNLGTGRRRRRRTAPGTRPVGLGGDVGTGTPMGRRTSGPCQKRSNAPRRGGTNETAENATAPPAGGRQPPVIG